MDIQLTDFQHHPHDAMFKASFQRKDLVQGFLRTVLPQNLLEQLQLEGMALDNNSYVDESLKHSFSDVVWTIPYAQGAVDAVFLFEHKRQRDKYALFQMLQYMLAIWKQDVKGRKQLRPLVPILVYQGKVKWSPGGFEKLFGHKKTLLEQFVPNFNYIFVDLQRLSFEHLAQQLDKLPYLGLLLLAKVDEPNLVELMAEAWNQAGQSSFSFDADYYRQWLTYMLYNAKQEPNYVYSTFYQKLKDEAMKAKVKSTAEQLIDMGIAKGIVQGIEKGMEKGMEKGIEKGQHLANLKFVKHLVQRGLPLNDIVTLTNLPLDTVKHLMAEIESSKN